MNFHVITLFPERYQSYLESGLPARAHKKGLFFIHPVMLRDFADSGRAGRVDDIPYGGGPGMIVQVGPVHRALSSVEGKYPVVLLTPRGDLLNQKMVRDFAKLPGLTLICGYYEGVDNRVAENLVDYEVSIGDFVLGSGDLAALCLIESITRLLPGYMGSDESHLVESGENGQLEYPQYSRPADYQGWKVPEVLLSGHHGQIASWREEKSREITQSRRGPKEG